MVEPAFPCTVEREAPLGGFHIFPGMTLRDWFAGQALPTLVATTDKRVTPEIIAQVAYQIADAMLAERSK